MHLPLFVIAIKFCRAYMTEWLQHIAVTVQGCCNMLLQLHESAVLLRMLSSVRAEVCRGTHALMQMALVPIKA